MRTAKLVLKIYFAQEVYGADNAIYYGVAEMVFDIVDTEEQSGYPGAK